MITRPLRGLRADGDGFVSAVPPLAVTAGDQMTAGVDTRQVLYTGHPTVSATITCFRY